MNGRTSFDGRRRDSDLDNVSPGSEKPDGFLLRLLGGHFSLRVTFWVVGLGVGVFQALVVTPVVPDPAGGWPVVVTVLISLVFHALVWIAIWNAAGRYEGRRAWGVLARVVVALWAVSVVMFAGFVLGLNVMFWGW